MTKKNVNKAKIYKYWRKNGLHLVAIDVLAKRSHPTMDALKMLQCATHSQSAGAPSSRLLRFHLPHWESLLTHCGYYKGLINIVSTIVYIHAPLNRSILPQPLRPKPGRRLGYFRGQSRGFVLLEKSTGAAETMLYQSFIGRARMETRPSKEHVRSACVILILKSSRGKEGTGQKGT